MKMQCCGSDDPKFDAQVIVMPRVADKRQWCAGVRVRCVHCKRHWRFEGLPLGVFGGMEPSSVSHMGYDALLPIAPLRIETAHRIIDEADPFEADEPAPKVRSSL